MTDLTTEEQRLVSDLMEHAPEELTPDELQEVASVLRVLPSSLRLRGSEDDGTPQRTYWFQADHPGLRSFASDRALAIVEHRAKENTMLVRLLVQEEVLFDIPLELGERLCGLGRAPA